MSREQLREQGPPASQLPGAIVAEHIRARLDYCLDYQDDKDMFEVLREELLALENTPMGSLEHAEFEAGEAEQSGQRQASSDVADAMFTKLKREGKVSIIDPDTKKHVSVQINPGDVDAHRTVIGQVVANVPREIEKPDGEEQKTVADAYQEGLDDLLKRVDESIDHLFDIFKLKDRTRGERIARFVMRRKTDVNDLTTQHEIDEPLVLEIKKMLRVLRNFRRNPLNTLIGEHLSQIQEQAYEAVRPVLEKQIAVGNSLIYRPPVDSPKSRPLVEDEPARRKSKPRPEPSAAASKDGEEKIEADLDANGEIVSDDGEIDIRVPWIDGGRTLHSAPVTKVQYEGRTFRYVKAIEPRLVKAAEASRKTVPTDADGRNMFDAIEIKMAKRLAAGIMPYENTNTVKRVYNIGRKSPDYEKVTAWYSFTISPNAPRMYFTLMSAEDLGCQDDALEGETFMVVLAETDKHHQVEVLKRLTGMSEADLVRGGHAGST